MDDLGSLDGYLFHRELRPSVEPPTPSAPRPELGREVAVTAVDGATLAGTLFPAPREVDDTRLAPRHGPVVIAGATGVKRRYYAPFAHWLSRRGFDVVTFDYRGIGGSRRAAKRPAMHQWGELDLAGVVEWAAQTLGDGRTALVGHSVGGQLIGLLPTETSARVRAIVTVAAQSGYYGLWPMPSRLAMALLWHAVVPGVTRAVGYLPGRLGVGENLPHGVALEWARWCRSPDYLASENELERRAGFASVRAPILAYGFDDDPYAPPAAIDALLTLYANARVERRRVEGTRIGHFGFFRSRFERTFWPEVASFLERAH